MIDYSRLVAEYVEQHQDAVLEILEIVPTDTEVTLSLDPEGIVFVKASKRI